MIHVIFECQMLINNDAEKLGAGLVRDLLTIHCEGGCFRDEVVVDVRDGHGDRLLRIGDHVVVAAPSSGLVDGGLKIVVGLVGLA